MTIALHRQMLYIGLALLGVVGTAAHAQAFVVDDRIVSAPGADIPDPEFDLVGNRVAFQDTAGQLWVGDVDPVTGDLYPADGRGTLVDTGLMGIQASGNGPEWVYGNGKTYIAYTRNEGGTPALGVAQQDANGVWQAQVLKKGLQRWNPFGTPDTNTSAPRIVYSLAGADGRNSVAWRDLGNPASEKILALTSEGGRWVEGESDFVAMNEDASGVRQVVLVDAVTGTYTQITSGSVAKLTPYMWWAPDYNDYLLMVQLGTTKIGIFRFLRGAWVQINTLTLPATNKPYINSPEPFVAGGKSYIFAVAAEKLGSGGTGLPLQPIGPTEIWIASVNKATPFFRRVDDPAVVAKKTEPEIFRILDDTVIMYTHVHSVTGKRMLRRAATGLGR